MAATDTVSKCIEKSMLFYATEIKVPVLLTKGEFNSMLANKRKMILGTAEYVMVILCLGFGCIASVSASSGEATNLFVGTVDGEEVIGVLDYTSKYYWSGGDDDISADFLCFDEEGYPKYQIWIRVRTNTKVGTYTNNSSSKLDYISMRRVFDEDDLRFHDYYRIIEGATDWEVNINTIDQEDSGIVEGSVDAKLIPSKYNSSPYPFKDEVEIEGTFSFQINTSHPVADEYRSGNPEFDEANERVYSASEPAVGSISYASSSEASSSIWGSVGESAKVCVACHGSKKCHVCHGMGWNSGSINLGGGYKRYKCSLCDGTGICTHCS